MVRPDAVKVHWSTAVCAMVTGADGTASMVTVTDMPSASFIWEASVRIQISSYSARFSPVSPVSCGRTNASPDGRMASWAYWAFYTFEVYVRGEAGRYEGPNNLVTASRAAATAVSESVTESVRM